MKVEMSDVSETIYFEKYCTPKTLMSFQRDKNSFLCDKYPNVKHKVHRLKKYKKLNYTCVLSEIIFSFLQLPDFRK